jgi:hypothetical protein
MDKPDVRPGNATADEDRKLLEKDRDFKQACRRYAPMRASTGT